MKRADKKLYFLAKWALLMTAIDALLTLIGVHMGMAEGNAWMNFFIERVGITLAVGIYFLFISFAILWLVIISKTHKVVRVLTMGMFIYRNIMLTFVSTIWIMHIYLTMRGLL